MATQIKFGTSGWRAVMTEKFILAMSTGQTGRPICRSWFLLRAARELPLDAGRKTEVY
jgi:hypothetical protein